MKLQQRLYILGIVTILIPYLGIPSSWKTVCTIIIGLSILLIAYRLHGRGSH